MIHIDGKVDPKENEWALGKLKSLPFSNEQKQILSDDLENGVDFDHVLSLVSDRKDRAFLLHLVRTIGHLDDQYDSNEKELYQKLHQKIMGNLDLQKLEQDIIESDYDHEVKIEDDDRSVIGKGIDYLINILS